MYFFLQKEKAPMKENIVVPTKSTKLGFAFC